jgi:FkbM family methyltransferase
MHLEHESNRSWVGQGAAMRFHLFHFTPLGLCRAASHLVAGRRLCRLSKVSLYPFIPDSVNSMTTAWNYKLTIQEAGLAPPGTIIDVGANTSQMTRLLALAGPRPPRVISFEPNNSLRPIGDVYRVALLERDGVVPFCVHSDPAWGRVGLLGESSSFDVRGSRFDTLVQAGEVILDELEKPLLVKIDTEGTELQVVEGFGSCLAHVDQMLIEVANRQEGVRPDHMFHLFRTLSAHGFCHAKILYACYDGSLAPRYADILFWK